MEPPNTETAKKKDFEKTTNQDVESVIRTLPTKLQNQRSSKVASIKL